MTKVERRTTLVMPIDKSEVGKKKIGKRKISKKATIKLGLYIWFIRLVTIGNGLILPGIKEILNNELDHT